jgi:hypothetical protein
MISHYLPLHYPGEGWGSGMLSHYLYIYDPGEGWGSGMISHYLSLHDPGEGWGSGMISHYLQLLLVCRAEQLEDSSLSAIVRGVPPLAVGG